MNGQSYGGYFWSTDVKELCLYEGNLSYMSHHEYIFHHFSGFGWTLGLCLNFPRFWWINLWLQKSLFFYSLNLPNYFGHNSMGGRRYWNWKAEMFLSKTVTKTGEENHSNGSEVNGYIHQRSVINVVLEKERPHKIVSFLNFSWYLWSKIYPSPSLP